MEVGRDFERGWGQERDRERILAQTDTEVRREK